MAAVQALRALLETKSVDYDFEYYKLPMPVDVAVTILSQGRALLQQCVDVVLPLRSLAATGKLSSLQDIWLMWCQAVPLPCGAIGS